MLSVPLEGKACDDRFPCVDGYTCSPEGLCRLGGAVGEGEGEGETPPRTCKELLALEPTTPTGSHAIDLDRDGLLNDGLIACQMDVDGGGWTLASAVNEASIFSTGCPGDWQIIDEPNDGFLGCRRDQVGGGQRTMTVAPPFAWRGVIGRVTGIAGGQPDGLKSTADDIDVVYVDGISFTTARSGGPREHIFTLVSAHPDDSHSLVSTCPCAGGRQPPAFVGDNVFCDKSSVASMAGGNGFDPSTPLWVTDSNVCEPPNQTLADRPFFVRADFFTIPAQRDIEVRLMSNEGPGDEDLAVTEMEIYVRE